MYKNLVGVLYLILMYTSTATREGLSTTPAPSPLRKFISSRLLAGMEGPDPGPRQVRGGTFKGGEYVDGRLSMVSVCRDKSRRMPRNHAVQCPQL